MAFLTLIVVGQVMVRRLDAPADHEVAEAEELKDHNIGHPLCKKPIFQVARLSRSSLSALIVSSSLLKIVSAVWSVFEILLNSSFSSYKIPLTLKAFVVTRYILPT